MKSQIKSTESKHSRIIDRNIPKQEMKLKTEQGKKLQVEKEIKSVDLQLDQNRNKQNLLRTNAAEITSKINTLKLELQAANGKLSDTEENKRVTSQKVEELERSLTELNQLQSQIIQHIHSLNINISTTNNKSFINTANTDRFQQSLLFNNESSQFAKLDQSRILSTNDARRGTIKVVDQQQQETKSFKEMLPTGLETLLKSIRNPSELINSINNNNLNNNNSNDSKTFNSNRN